MNTKKLVIGIVSGCLLLIILIIVSGYLLISRVIVPAVKRTVETPPEMKTARIVKGADVVTKEDALTDPRLGSVTDIRFGTFDSKAGNGVAVAGTDGVLFLSLDMKIKAGTFFRNSAGYGGYPRRYSSYSSRIRIVETDGDDSCEYLSTEGSWSHEFSVLDHNGLTLWTYSGNKSGIDSISPGDIDGDGKMDFAVGFNGSGGIRLVDSTGSERWKESGGNIWHVEIADIDGNGNPSIIHNDASGQLIVRNAQGDVVRRLGGGTSGKSLNFSTAFVTSFDICRWPNVNSPQRVVVPRGEGLTILDENGTQLATFKEPHVGFMSEIAVKTVKLKTHEPAYLAVIVTNQLWNRSALSIYASTGNTLYEEVLPLSTTTLGVLPAAKNTSEALLVGGESKVWKYTAK